MTQRWLVPINKAPDARLRLVCVPHAGAGTVPFRPWGPLLEPDVELLVVLLPGRERRIAEPPLTRMPALREAILPELRTGLADPCVVLGHSTGAPIAFELARSLEALGRPPRALYVAGYPPPHLTPHGPVVHLLSDEGLARHLQMLGGTPDAVLRDPSILRTFLRPIRADYEVAETYRDPAGPALSAPIVALAGVDDLALTFDEAQAWDRHTAGGVSLRLLPGGHFFLHAESRPVVIAGIRDEVR